MSFVLLYIFKKYIVQTLQSHFFFIIDAQKRFKSREITQNNLLSEMDWRIQGIYLTALTLIPEIDNF